MDKREVASILEEIGTLLEIQGENPFKCRAYFTGAKIIEQLEGDLTEWVNSGRIQQVKGIGKALATKVTELVTTGRLAYYERLKESVPPGLLEMVKVPYLGPRKVKALYEGLGISSVRELEYACQENRLLDLPGFGPKTQENILKGIELIKRYRGQFLVSEAKAVAERLLDLLKGCGKIERLALAGGLRRCQETVENIDIIAVAEDPPGLLDTFIHTGEVEEVLSQGPGHLQARSRTGLGITLRLVKPQEFPFSLFYFTGNEAHINKLRSRAQGRGLDIRPQGIFHDGEQIFCREEEEIYGLLGLSYIPPELREDTGEIEAAAEGRLPRLIELGDIKGVFHVHSTYSDGTIDLEGLARYGQAKGLEYIGIADHSQSAQYAHGLKLEDLQRQHQEIDRLNRSLKGIRLLKGIEVDILPDGSLDYEDSILAQFDFVIASVHSRFKMGLEEMTNRIIKALSNPHVTILGHPTGRLLLARDSYPVDIYRVIDAAARYHKLLEINANPYRLDLDWRLCKYARQRGVKLCIGPDAHGLEGMNDIVYGVNVARRGWLGPEVVINALSGAELEAFLREGKQQTR